jgi:hypothetical protein
MSFNALSIRRLAAGLVVAAIACADHGQARAADVGAPVAVATEKTAAPLAAPPTTTPPPYALPWQLRGMVPGTVVRSDTSVAFYEDPNTHSDGNTIASLLFASYKLTPNLAPLIRLGTVQNNAPGVSTMPKPAYPTASGSVFVNPLLGVLYGRRFDAFRVAGFLGGTVPIGQGGGDTPDKGAAGAEKLGAQARSGMDNAMFAVNYFAAIGGLDGAYIGHRLTVQAEATLFQLLRTRGENNGAASHDSARTNSTFGLSAGYFVLPFLALSGELHYQRWLSTPTTAATATDAVTGAKTTTVSKFTDAQLDTVSFAVGPRFNFKIGSTMWFRPGVSYARILDKPLKTASYDLVQLDLPIVF